jgi:hypothetical protein
MKTLSALFLLLIACDVATAQRLRLDIQTQQGDMVGERFAFALKEQIRNSATYVLTSSEKETAVDVNLLSVPVKKGETTFGSAISILMTIRDQSCGGLAVMNLGHEVLLISDGNEKQMAQSLLADIDSNFDGWRKFVSQESPSSSRPKKINDN